MVKKDFYKQSPTIKIKKTTKDEMERLDFVKFGMTRNKILRFLINFYKKNEKKK